MLWCDKNQEKYDVGFYISCERKHTHDKFNFLRNQKNRKKKKRMALKERRKLTMRKYKVRVDWGLIKVRKNSGS